MHFWQFLTYFFCSDTSSVSPLYYSHHVHARVTFLLKCQLRKLFSLAFPLCFLMSAFVLIPGCSFALAFPSLWFPPSPSSLVLILSLLCLSVPFLESPASLYSFRGNFSMSLYNSHWASSYQECTSRLSGAGDRLRDRVVTEGREGSVRFVTSVFGEAGKTDTSVFRTKVSQETLWFSLWLSGV